MEWIQGNKFKAMTSIYFAPRRGKNADEYRDAINNFPSSDYRYLTNTYDKRNIKLGDIIYTHTFYIDQLFEIIDQLPFNVKVVSHNADTPAGIEPPANVTWYTTNVNIKHDRVQSIPIGIENDRWLKDKKDKMNLKLKQRKEFKNMLYLNHNIKTNPEKRQAPYDLLAGLSWVTTSNGANGQGFDSYLDNIYNHPFVVCPEGNGIDTHRVWECLYMKTIPIQVRTINNQFYIDLPIVFIDSWEEVTQDFLYKKYMDFAEMKWNLEKLDFQWWKQLINKQ
ncbi:MAG: hypothetical protein ABFC18_03215 [Rikenellaceae bacterium]